MRGSGGVSRAVTACASDVDERRSPILLTSHPTLTLTTSGPFLWSWTRKGTSLSRIETAKFCSLVGNPSRKAKRRLYDADLTHCFLGKALYTLILARGRRNLTTHAPCACCLGRCMMCPCCGYWWFFPIRIEQLALSALSSARNSNSLLVIVTHAKFVWSRPVCPINPILV